MRHRRLRPQRRAGAAGLRDGRQRRPARRPHLGAPRTSTASARPATWSSTSTCPGRTARPTRDALSDALRARIDAVPTLRAVRRVTVTPCLPSGEFDHLTFRPGPDGVEEQQLIRGMHPLTGQRLDLWRMREFDGVRLPSPEDTYLYKAVAKDNPADERLFAMAEVRDLTPLRDGQGAIVGFPTVERLLAACLDGLRREQARPRAGQAPGPQPDLPVRLAVHRAAARGHRRVRQGRRAAHRRRRARGDRAAVPAARGGRRRRRSGWRCGSPSGPGAGVDDRGHRPADRADAAARRLHPEGPALAGPRRDVPVRADAAAGRRGRHLRRARPRRERRARAGRPAAGAEPRRRRRRRWSARRPSATPRA